jgi:site-specific DNA-methyltransferase (adenine-specific)
MVDKVLFSSNSDDWATPEDLFEELNREFNFDLDVCASESNHKTPEFFTAEIDGLSQNWGGVGCSVIRLILIFRHG